MTKRCVLPTQALLLLYCGAVLVKTESLSVETDELPVRELRNKDNINGIQIEEEIERIKQHILSELGMESAPDSSQVNVNDSELNRVLEIYHRNIRNSNVQEKLEDEDEIVHKSYTFRDEVPLQLNFSDDLVPSRGLQTLFFTLDHVTNNTRGLTVDFAKLSIYKAHKGVHHKAVGRIGRSDATSNTEEPQEATVFIYQLQEPSYMKDPERILVTAQRILLDTDSWEVFDVAKAVETWMDNSALNFGLHIECSECEANDFTFISMNSTEIPNQSHSRDYKKGEIHSYQAPGRAVLDIELTESTARMKRSKPNARKHGTKYPFDCTGDRKTKLCCRYSMNVSFEELQWNWIVKPKYFQAYFCKGKCVRNGKNYASNHAIIQNLMRRKKNRRRKIPRPCCAPKKMKPLDIVYKKNKSEVDTKQLKGMIVSQCSCS